MNEYPRLRSSGDPEWSPAMLPGAAPLGRVAPKLQIYDHRKIDEIPHLGLLRRDIVDGIRVSARVFPFKVNRYVLDELIDWNDAPDDPIFRLTFPQAEMLEPGDAARLRALIHAKAPDHEINDLVSQIRARMNPHPADQVLNTPVFRETEMTGLQHKYKETVLFFPKQGQTCHSYCTFCFRWPQFVAGSPHKFESNDAAALHAYLMHHEEVTDLLITGGDPMVMNTRRLRGYLEPLLAPQFRHVQNIRIGTKALTYWPYRFLTEPDSNDLLALIRQLVDGGKHVAVMAHINHWREMVTEPFQCAVDRLNRVGAVIRSQGPILRHINDDAETWRRNWQDQVRLGIVPYYMFVERDTGARRYFELPLARALDIYASAFSRVSGIARTARGPTMSTGPGKVQVLGKITLSDQQYFVLSFLQARRHEWLQKPFLAKYSEDARWFDQLQPPDDQALFFFSESYNRFSAGNGSGDHPVAVQSAR